MASRVKVISLDWLSGKLRAINNLKWGLVLHTLFLGIYTRYTDFHCVMSSDWSDFWRVKSLGRWPKVPIGEFAMREGLLQYVLEIVYNTDAQSVSKHPAGPFWRYQAEGLDRLFFPEAGPTDVQAVSSVDSVGGLLWKQIYRQVIELTFSYTVLIYILWYLLDQIVIAI